MFVVEGKVVHSKNHSDEFTIIFSRKRFVLASDQKIVTGHEHRGVDNIQEQISDHIFVPNAN